MTLLARIQFKLAVFYEERWLSLEFRNTGPSRFLLSLTSSFNTGDFFSELINEGMTQISPAAAIAVKLAKSGMTLTQVSNVLKLFSLSLLLSTRGFALGVPF